MQVCDHPGRYDKIYYCKNANDDEELIGMGIFHIEDNTRRYITAKLIRPWSLPFGDPEARNRSSSGDPRLDRWFAHGRQGPALIPALRLEFQMINNNT